MQKAKLFLPTWDTLIWANQNMSRALFVHICFVFFSFQLNVFRRQHYSAGNNTVRIRTQFWFLFFFFSSSFFSGSQWFWCRCWWSHAFHRVITWIPRKHFRIFAALLRRIAILLFFVLHKQRLKANETNAEVPSLSVLSKDVKSAWE